MNTPYIPYFYIIRHKPSNRLYAGSRYTPKSQTANPSEFWKEGGYFTSSKRIKRLIKLDGVDSFEIVEIITEPEIKIPFGWSNIIEFETSFLTLVDAKNNIGYINSHNNVFVKPQDHLFWETLTDAERTINGKEGAETCRKLGVNAFFDPVLRNEICVLGGKAQGKVNAGNGHLSNIANQYWDAVRSGKVKPKPYKYYTNQIIDIRVSDGDNIPDGFVAGSHKRGGFVWYNDGITNFKIRKGDDISFDLCKGRI